MEINKQRCFTIKREHLKLLLVALDMNFTSNMLKPTADYIFQNGNEYDVVISYRGSYPYVEKEIEKFIESMSTT